MRSLKVVVVDKKYVRVATMMGPKFVANAKRKLNTIDCCGEIDA